ncbi:hypothetical protein HMPREF2141_02213 [Bacteroides uniformis]|nr:hypothetical protein HMPREF2141_02213 [Bacteroides uniformis]
MATKVCHSAFIKHGGTGTFACHANVSVSLLLLFSCVNRFALSFPAIFVK